MTIHDGPWTIDDLDAQVAQALSASDYDGPADERARSVPDRRTIRYYTTLGLLDKPAGWRGRTALYGRRHLLQIVAVKRLQAKGLTLAQVQERLLGLGDASLARLAKLPAKFDAMPPPPTSPRRETFWADPTASPVESPAAPQASSPEAATIRGVPLSDGLMLLLPALREIDDDDVEAIRAAAGPLVKLLRTRRLVNSRHERTTP